MSLKKENKLKLISAMRGIALDSINKAKQGHIGMALGASEIFYSLICENLKFTEKEPKWINRDRFVLSAGHGSMGMYAAYHFMNLLSVEDMKNHKEFNSKTPSHPEIDKLNLVDASTGPLGQGIAMAVGMAISQKYLANKYNKDRLEIIDHNVFVLCGDGDLQEGVALEAIQLAGTQRLGKLIIIHDYNNMQIDSKADEVNNLDFEKYFKAHNFTTIILKSNDIDEINKAIKQARLRTKPTYIQIPTTIAYKTKMQNSSKGHNGILNEQDTIEYKKSLKLTDLNPFEYSKDFYQLGKYWLNKKEIFFSRWKSKMDKYRKAYPELANEIEQLKNKQYNFDFSNFKFNQTNVATRNYIGEIMNYIDNNFKFVMGGSADLRAATKVGFDKDFKNIKYGIREFAMSAINNGIYLDSNIKTIGSTFLVFSDYAKAALRLGALMEIPSISIFTHDSYQVGGDGPTHQPIEQLTSLRSIPNYLVLRPADENEMLNAFKYALNSKTTPVAIIACRQELKSYNLQKTEFKAAYFIKNRDNFDISILASGSEVQLAEQVANELEKENIIANVISVPALQLLVNDQKLVLDLKLDLKPMFAIEASNDHLWYKLSKYNKFDAYLAKDFGHSAPGQFVYEHNGFNKNNLVNLVKEFLKK
ncbi:transketolase [Mesomycoplasma lagogenitalium]|uniref:Transketolase n=1 Tax=Mesomycoplasma lagogenitalium TaxID=171286 RepID=A0ABY8LUQ3_9BACT|nr:transketolase [Mesomycoplasma lagogenitalium]WGI36968.1 transketolase [Mesomycoplasma lagogenitalium]